MIQNFKHPYYGQTFHFATKHHKEKALKPIFAKIGMHCSTVKIDTDKFGTFSGEVERVGRIRETLRLKLNAAIEVLPKERLFIASEGSFGPHPFYPFIQSDHEALLFIDRTLEIEIYAEEISTLTNHAEIEIRPGDDYQNFLKQIRFPDHGVILILKGKKNVVYKNLQDIYCLDEIINKSYQSDASSKLTLLTDMRAHRNPTRMEVIKKAGEKLIHLLQSLCPKCQTPGFSITEAIPGLPCEDCQKPTQVHKALIWKCVKCDYKEQKDRADQVKSANASECDFCNP